MAKPRNIRVRFAPSPTGYLHVGGVRTALYNFLFARKHGGVFVLRIEDTDRSRYVEGAVENLIDTLRWAGLSFDEGPEAGGQHGPYVQSERLSIYRLHVESLLNSGFAYRCFCTPERLDAMRKAQEKSGAPTKYDRRCLALTKAEIESNIRAGMPSVVRMKVPQSTSVIFYDVIRERIEFSSDLIDDQVLLKSDGYPTYHLANVVDDHLMGITHVIRGEEWLSSTPKHLLLYHFFGWTIPTFAHLPLLLNPDRTKLSKRQGDVAVEDYRQKGYLPEALVNFVSLLGWNPGTEQEYFTIDDLVGQFSLDRVNKAGAVFNLEKLKWLNEEHLRKKPDTEMLTMLRKGLEGTPYKNNAYSDEYLVRVISVMRERISFIHDITEKGAYFFAAPDRFDEDVVKKRWKPETREHLNTLATAFEQLQSPEKDLYELTLQETAKSLGISNGDLIHAVRLAVSGTGGGPGVYDILSILGKNESIKRIKYAIKTIGA